MAAPFPLVPPILVESLLLCVDVASVSDVGSVLQSGSGAELPSSVIDRPIDCLVVPGFDDWLDNALYWHLSKIRETRLRPRMTLKERVSYHSARWRSQRLRLSLDLPRPLSIRVVPVVFLQLQNLPWLPAVFSDYRIVAHVRLHSSTIPWWESFLQLLCVFSMASSTRDPSNPSEPHGLL